MKILKQFGSDVVLSAVEIIVGILLLVDAESFSTGAIIVFGAALLILAIVQFVKYFKTDAIEAAEGSMFFVGLICFVAGCFCIFAAGWLMKTFASFITVVYGVGIMLAGLGKVQWTVDALRIGGREWLMPLVTALVSIICAVVILLNPFATVKALWIFTGIALIVEAIVDVASIIVKKRGGEDKV